MSPESSSAPAYRLPTALRAWRASLARTFVQPGSVTLLALDPDEVARRLSAASEDAKK